MTSTNRQFSRQLVLMVLVNLVALATWFVFFYQIAGLSRSIAEITQERVAEEAKEEGGRRLARQTEETKALRDKLDKYFLFDEEQAITNFLEGLESLGRQADLDLVIASVDRTEKELRLTFRTSGSFGSTYYLIKLIETLPMKVSLESVRLSAVAKELSGPSWEGLFVLKVESFIAGKNL